MHLMIHGSEWPNKVSVTQHHLFNKVQPIKILMISQNSWLSNNLILCVSIQTQVHQNSVEPIIGFMDI